MSGGAGEKLGDLWDGSAHQASESLHYWKGRNKLLVDSLYLIDQHLKHK